MILRYFWISRIFWILWYKIIFYQVLYDLCQCLQ